MRKIYFIVALLVLTFQISAQNQIKMTSVNINLRTTPHIEENVICIIPKGTILSVDYTNQEYSEWIKIDYNGKSGYVYSKYIINPEVKNNSNYHYNQSGSSVKYYTNSKGEKVQSPTYYNSPPAGATAECKDGTYSFSRSRRGTCSHHGGVKRWLK